MAGLGLLAAWGAWRKRWLYAIELALAAAATTVALVHVGDATAAEGIFVTAIGAIGWFVSALIGLLAQAPRQAAPAVASPPAAQVVAPAAASVAAAPVQAVRTAPVSTAASNVPSASQSANGVHRGRRWLIVAIVVLVCATGAGAVYLLVRSQHNSGAVGTSARSLASPQASAPVPAQLVRLTLPVHKLATQLGVAGPGPAYPAHVTVQAPVGAAKELAAYGIAGVVLLAPRGWTASGAFIGADGAQRATLCPGAASSVLFLCRGILFPSRAACRYYPHTLNSRCTSDSRR